MTKEESNAQKSAEAADDDEPDECRGPFRRYRDKRIFSTGCAAPPPLPIPPLLSHNVRLSPGPPHGPEAAHQRESLNCPLTALFHRGSPRREARFRCLELLLMDVEQQGRCHYHYGEEGRRLFWLRDLEARDLEARDLEARDL
ncbi:hypothetical protein FZEAL_5588, partial [Fusarium zealandicum]